MGPRKIIHVDMDAFYASVEQRDFPEYKGKPLIVGGPPNSRSVVAAASYEARKFGVRSAMPSAKAAQLAPRAIFVFPRFEVYKEVSRQIREIFLEYTDRVEMLSLDEGYLDVTFNKKNIPFAVSIAKEIRKEILARTGLTASAGVGNSKFIAKLASEKNKPDGLTVVLPEDVLSFIDPLPVSSFHGVGKVTARRMEDLGIRFGRDLRRKSLNELIQHFGKAGIYYHKISRGEDDREVEPFRERKSLGAEITFDRDRIESEDLLTQLKYLADEVERRLKKRDFSGRTLTLKVKFHDFTLKTRSKTLAEPVYLAEDLFPVAKDLLGEFFEKKGEGFFSSKAIRLLGISLSHPNPEEQEKEPELFPNF
ncbi:DNA polymerase IV [Leptospira gomenensis]|uniref:DNA polymerase IV n=1 Tax=Leptospira gomenensis TaxID=2484974 RepID=A0A5F1YG59_9LEPT|nr:DNA polymerase IV [Leptospira gomenensis]TGK39241.1 DNA polymerase IV [Leptospira gomenensis]TGK42545.1 DNA polymerase IV [Leptospira gomenensis]TGK48911.1 DNA polymerase IV [Leptospira gomenensis]TGK54621.1 DNA polymerase IV [Leptospira gomenensis]